MPMSTDFIKGEKEKKSKSMITDTQHSNVLCAM